MFNDPEKISYHSLNKACTYKFKQKTDKMYKLPEAALVTGGGGKGNPPPPSEKFGTQLERAGL